VRGRGWAQGNILENIELIEGLEETKRTAVEIEEKVKLAKMTEIQIAKAREVYRPVATRGSLVYFLIDNLNALDRVYHYSMANFVFVLKKGMDMTPGGKDESKVSGPLCVFKCVRKCRNGSISG
jgi:dynein heavy chain